MQFGMTEVEGDPLGVGEGAEDHVRGWGHFGLEALERGAHAGEAVIEGHGRDAERAAFDARDPDARFHWRVEELVLLEAEDKTDRQRRPDGRTGEAVLGPRCDM